MHTYKKSFDPGTLVRCVTRTYITPTRAAMFFDDNVESFNEWLFNMNIAYEAYTVLENRSTAIVLDSHGENEIMLLAPSGVGWVVWGEIREA